MKLPFTDNSWLMLPFPLICLCVYFLWLKVTGLPFSRMIREYYVIGHGSRLGRVLGF